MKLCCCGAKYKCIQGLTNLAGTTDFTIERPKSQNERVLLTGVRRPAFNNVKTKQTKQNKVDLNLI